MKLKLKIKSAHFGFMSGLIALTAGTLETQATSIRFQEGVEITVDGVGTGIIYSGTQDTYLDGAYNNGGNAGGFLWSNSVPMIRFDDLFGATNGLIPVGAQVTSASLALSQTYATNYAQGTIGSYGAIHADQPWDESTATYATVLGGNGVQFGTDVDLLGTLPTQFFIGPIDVTASLIDWALEPVKNNGWAFKRTNGGNTGWASSENPSITSRPVLTVEFILPNVAPTALAGAGQSIRAGDTVSLNGSASFDDNTASGALVYAWSFQSVPTGSTAALVDAGTATPSFIADVAGSYVVELLVTDEQGVVSPPDSVIVSSDNQAPTSVATVDFGIAIVGATSVFDGSGSTDPELDALTYSWAVTAAPVGSTATLVGATTASPTLTTDLEGTYQVTLAVSDFIGAGTSATVEVVATTPMNYAEMQIVSASDMVAALLPSQVTNKGNQTALGNFLKNATKNLQKGKIANAIADLNSALERTDGCPLRGSPDGNGQGMDWITDCAAQADIYALLTAAVSALQ